MKKAIMKIMKYGKIKSNNVTSFEMLYNSSNRTVAILEKLIKENCNFKNNEQEEKLYICLNKIIIKNQQMVACYKNEEQNK